MMKCLIFIIVFMGNLLICNTGKSEISPISGNFAHRQKFFTIPITNITPTISSSVENIILIPVCNAKIKHHSCLCIWRDWSCYLTLKYRWWDLDCFSRQNSMPYYACKRFEGGSVITWRLPLDLTQNLVHGRYDVAKECCLPKCRGHARIFNRISYGGLYLSTLKSQMGDCFDVSGKRAPGTVRGIKLVSRIFQLLFKEP